MPDVDPLTADWSTEQTEVMQRLRDWATSFAELNLNLATWMDLPSSDANALGHIVWAAEDGHPLTPADLSRQIGMTSGATTVLLNRLESAGHIRRSREHDDRRRVTLRPEPSAREQARAFLAESGAEIAHVVQSTPPEHLRIVADFATRLGAASTEANTRLRQRPRP
ncbi:MarR family winged helix-turn-helix transcriptional regulator [Okibacterium fritillariae]|jgi:DNA-binding MarR family transcriptional regulator|uniref:DNA-binding transcriptional regulator, MarR family n=1 Tax=Okibacterium fritillariae TaxID=123320 RepID=A0A1T5IJV3_9MICO|nr:MarR family transcriptional regulator [Okibacterium fritillariae]SKC39312.1 DNA-binding transcriptional regulator, MarR family [Okibacterium fritillariae]